MNIDAIFAFATSVLAAAGTLFASNPTVAGVLSHVSQILALLGTALHLDGK